MNSFPTFFAKHYLKLLFTLFLFVVFISNQVEAQTRSRSRGKTISVTHSLNIRQKADSYNWIREYQEERDTLFLRFLTSTSGTFNIKEGDPYNVIRSRESTAPSITFFLGASVRLLNNDNFMFHEFAITRFVIGKQEDRGTYVLELPGGNLIRPFGFTQRFTHLSLRYSIGKYFVKNRKSKTKFGVSGGVEPSVFTFKQYPYSPWYYPLKGTIYSIEFSIQPQLSIALSKYLSLDFSLLSNFLVADFGKLNELDPSLVARQRGGERNYKVPDITMGFGVALKYAVKNTGARR